MPSSTETQKILSEMIMHVDDESDDFLQNMLQNHPDVIAALARPPKNDETGVDVSMINRLAITAAATDIGCWSLDLRTRRGRVNRQWLQMYLVEREKCHECDNMLWTDFMARVRVHPEDIVLRTLAYQKALESPKQLDTIRFSLRLLGDDNQTVVRYVQVTGRLLCDVHTGEPNILLGVAWDSTDSVQGQIATQKQHHLAELIEQQKQHQVELKHFTNFLMHETRVPLASIEGSCSLLGGAMESIRHRFETMTKQTQINVEQVQNSFAKLRETFEEMKEYMHSMQTCIEHQKAVLNGALDLGKLEAGAVELKQLPFHLDDLAQSVVTMMQHSKSNGTRSGRNVVLQCIFEDAKGNVLPPSTVSAMHSTTFALMGDSFCLKQVLINLVGNALKFCFRGSVTIRLRLVHETQKEARFDVAVVDTGVGIPAEILEKGVLFNPFKQAHDRSFHGSGLGLSICQKLVHLFDATQTIHVKSEVNVGSEFSFVLTFPKSNNVADQQIDASDQKSPKVSLLEAQRKTASATPIANEVQTTPSAVAAATATAAVNNKKRVIIVEDNAIYQKILAKFVREAGYETIAFSDGASLVEFVSQDQTQCEIEQHDILAAIVDMNMPQMDGMQAITLLRNCAALASFPVCCLSGYSDAETRERALAAGFTDYHTKPISKTQVQALLQRYHGLVNEENS